MVSVHSYKNHLRTNCMNSSNIRIIAINVFPPVLSRPSKRKVQVTRVNRAIITDAIGIFCIIGNGKHVSTELVMLLLSPMG